MKLLRRLVPVHRELFYLACLAGIIPAFVTNTIPATAAFPGVEDFRWSYFDLGLARFIFIVVFLAAFSLGVFFRKRAVLLAVVPLLALIVTPVDRIGAVRGYDVAPTWEVTETDWSLKPERAAIARLSQAKDDLDAFLSDLPPALPNTAWLEAKLLRVDAARGAAVGLRAKYEAQITVLNKQIQQWQAEMSQRSAIGKAVATVRNTPLIAANKKRIQQITAQLNSKAPAAQQSAVAALTDLRASIRLHETWLAEKRATYLEAAYLISSALLLLYFVWHFGVGNWVMAAFLVLATVASFWSASRAWAGDWLLYPLASLYPVFIGAMVILVLRVLFRAVQDNREIRQNFSTRELGKASFLALILWSPFAAIVILSYTAGQYFYRAVSERIYCERMELKDCVPPFQAMVQDSDPSRDTLREDLHITVEKLYADFEEQALATSRRANYSAPSAIEKVRADLLGAFNSIIRENIWDYEGGPKKGQCALWRPMDCVRNFSLDIVNRAYSRPRNRMYNAFDNRVTTAANAAKQAAQLGAKAFETAIRGQAAAASRETRKHVDALLLGVAALAALESAAVILIALRALLLIFARLLFAQNKSMFTTITHRERRLEPDAPRADATFPQDDTLHIDLANGRLHVIRRFDVSDAAPDTFLRPPHPFQWPVRRILKRCYWLNTIDATDEPRSIGLQSTHGAHFFKWSIPPGSEVAFQWDTFVGISDTVELRKTFSLKLGTLALGRVMIPSARGPGLLLQRSYGKADKQPKAVSPARLLSWEFGTGFRVEAAKSKTSVYVDYCQVMRDDKGAAVLDAPREGSGGKGIWRELVGLFRL